MTSIIGLLIASHPESPVEDLNRLSKDRDDAIRMAVAENPNTPTSTLVLLTRDDSPRVSQAAHKALANHPQSTITWVMGQNMV